MSDLTDRQRHIVDQAIAMIHESGITGLTMRRLSKRIGVSEPALYRHFENKSAIFSAMLDVLEAETYHRLPKDDSPTPDSIRKHFVRLFELFAERPALAVVVLEDEFVSEEPDLHARIRTLFNMNHARLSEAFGTMALRGVPDWPVDAESLATLLLGGVRLLIREWRLDRCEWDLVKRGNRLVASLTDLMIGGNE